MNRLNLIMNERSKLLKHHANEIALLDTKAMKEFIKLMESKKDIINKWINDVKCSRDLTRHDYNDYYSTWIRVDFSKLIDVENGYMKNLLSDYLRDEFFVECDFYHDTISMSIGPAIIINHKGDVYDEDLDEWIIHNDDYKSDAELYSLIEAHMEKTEHYPSVIFENYYYANFVDTRPTERQS